jgi:anti-sigma factor RsiW
VTTHADNPAPGDDLLHAFVDGAIAPRDEAAVRARLAADPQAARDVAAWARQREALRALHSSVLAEPAPASLRQAAARLDRHGISALHWQRWGALAASVLVAFGAGWLAGGRWDAHPAATTIAGAAAARHFAQQALIAHAVFQPEVRHPVEVSAAQQDHLVQWLSKRLGRPLKVPVLTPQGYQLMGGRLLPGEQGVRAQFMYQNGAGERITLYLGALKPGSGADTHATAFRFLDDGPVPGFYWVDQGFGYAIAGQLPRAALQELASAVYSQL